MVKSLPNCDSLHMKHKDCVMGIFLFEGGCYAFRKCLYMNRLEWRSMTNIRSPNTSLLSCHLHIYLILRFQICSNLMVLCSNVDRQKKSWSTSKWAYFVTRCNWLRKIDLETYVETIKAFLLQYVFGNQILLNARYLNLAKNKPTRPVEHCIILFFRFQSYIWFIVSLVS